MKCLDCGSYALNIEPNGPRCDVCHWRVLAEDAIVELAVCQRENERLKSDQDKIISWGPADAGRLVFEELARVSAELAECQQQRDALLAALEILADCRNYFHAVSVDGSMYSPPVTCWRGPSEPDELASTAIEATKGKK